MLADATIEIQRSRWAALQAVRAVVRRTRLAYSSEEDLDDLAHAIIAYAILDHSRLGQLASGTQSLNYFVLNYLQGRYDTTSPYQQRARERRNAQEAVRTACVRAAGKTLFHYSRDPSNQGVARAAAKYGQDAYTSNVRATRIAIDEGWLATCASMARSSVLANKRIASLLLLLIRERKALTVGDAIHALLKFIAAAAPDAREPLVTMPDLVTYWQGIKEDLLEAGHE